MMTVRFVPAFFASAMDPKSPKRMSTRAMRLKPSVLKAAFCVPKRSVASVAKRSRTNMKRKQKMKRSRPARKIVDVVSPSFGWKWRVLRSWRTQMKMQSATVLAYCSLLARTRLSWSSILRKASRPGPASRMRPTAKKLA